MDLIGHGKIVLVLDDVLDGDLEVGERSAHHCKQLDVALRSLALARGRIVLDDVGRENLVQGLQVAARYGFAELLGRLEILFLTHVMFTLPLPRWRRVHVGPTGLDMNRSPTMRGRTVLPGAVQNVFVGYDTSTPS